MVALKDQLERVCRGPKQLGDAARGGALVAFALHCLMIGEGFKPKHMGGQKSKLVPNDWNTKYSDEWIFEYTRAGFSSNFFLHCSLQASSGKMFVQARDSQNPTNLHSLGLQVEKYIPDPSRCQSKTWDGVFEHEAVLTDMMQQYVMEPLISQAAPRDEDVSLLRQCRKWLVNERETSNGLGSSLHSDLTWAKTIGLGMGLVAVASLTVLMIRKRQTG